MTGKQPDGIHPEEHPWDMLLAGPPFSVYFARPLLDLIGQFVEPPIKYREV
jgi:hypothetical protein